MKIVGIVCSPRAQGNTEVLVQTSLNKAKMEGAEVELVTINGKIILPCDACLACAKTGQCHIKDDVPAIFSKMIEADGLIFGSPVYFWSVTAQAKALIDRTYLFRVKRELNNKAAGVIVTQGGSGDMGAINDFISFISLQKMIYVGRAVGFGREKGEVKNDLRGIAQAELLAETMVAFLKTRRMPLLAESLFKVETKPKEVK
jgi:multimeric flavodoxin WrbA